MQQTAIKSGSPPNAAPSAAFTATPERSRPQPKAKSVAFRCLEAAASLRVTVVLFAVAIFLVYFGTWAQKDASIWTVVKQYFRSFYVLMPLKVLLQYSVDPKWVEGYWLPFPGGWLIGGALLINLIAAHAVRFKISWSRAGILLIHAGLIVMMVGELVTGVFAIEGHMFIMEGNTSNFVDHTHACELAFVDRSGDKEDREVLISGATLAAGGTIQHELLPFDVEVAEYMGNSDFYEIVGPDAANRATTGIGLRKLAKAKKETSGTDSQQKTETPSAYITLRDKATHKPLGTFLVSTYFTYLQRQPEEIVVDGKRYAIYLRYERDYRDYDIRLISFHHDTYTGTEKAKNYESVVSVKERTANSKQGDRIRIYMNHPLFFQGETFYQAELHPLTKGTVLQVVRNPGWWMPYISCLMVTGGMLVHFGMHLFKFLERRQAA